MREKDTDPKCPYCGDGYDNIQHALLTCKHEQPTSIRDTLENSLESIMNPNQLKELRTYGNHDKKMCLLGKQMQVRLSIQQQRDLDTAVKQALQTMDDHRTQFLNLNPMCGHSYTRPTEETMQQAALWHRMWREDQDRQQQQQSFHQHPADEPDTWDI